MIAGRHLFNTLIVLLLPWQYSFVMGFSGIVLSDMRQEFANSKESYFTWFSNIVSYFTGVSSIISIFIFYRFSRKKIILSGLLCFSGVMWLLYLTLGESTFWLAVLYRSIQGCLVGSLQMITTPYVFYMAPDKFYGFYGTLIQVSMFFSLVVLYSLFSQLSWRNVAIVNAVISFLCGGMILLVPDLKTIGKKKDRIYHRESFKKILVIIMVMVFQQLSGIGTMIENLPRMMSNIGLNLSSNYQSVIMNSIGFIATLVSAFISDSISRKNIWAFSCSGLVIGFIIYGVTLKVDDIAHWVGTLGIFVYFLFYGLGIGPIPWFLCCELFPESLRLEASGLNTFINSLFSIIMAQVNPLMVGDRGFGEFGQIIFFACVSLLSIFFGLLFIPDTVNNDMNSVVTVI